MADWSGCGIWMAALYVVSRGAASHKTIHNLVNLLITLFARNSTDCGIVRPICFAVFEIDHKVDGIDSLHRQVLGFTSQNALNILRGQSTNFVEVHAIAGKASFCDGT
jgi:hypothetical protein